MTSYNLFNLCKQCPFDCKKMKRKIRDNIESSSSSDECDRENLREAVDVTFFTDEMFNKLNDKGNKLHDKGVSSEVKSLRQLDNEQLHIDVRASSALQKHIGRKLSMVISEMVEYVDRTEPDVGGSKPSGGVRLLSDSEHCLDLDSNSAEIMPRMVRKKICRRKLDGGEDDRRDLSGVVVSGEYLLSGEATKHWRSRKKGEHLPG